MKSIKAIFVLFLAMLIGMLVLSCSTYPSASNFYVSLNYPDYYYTVYITNNPGKLLIGGSAWCDYDTIKSVKVNLNGDGYREASVSNLSSSSSYVDWHYELELNPGDCIVDVMASNATGNKTSTDFHFTVVLVKVGFYSLYPDLVSNTIAGGSDFVVSGRVTNWTVYPYVDIHINGKFLSMTYPDTTGWFAMTIPASNLVQPLNRIDVQSWDNRDQGQGEVRTLWVKVK